MLSFPPYPASLAFYTCFTSFASNCCVSVWHEPQRFWLICSVLLPTRLLDSSIGSPSLVAHLVGTGAGHAGAWCRRPARLPAGRGAQLGPHGPADLVSLADL